MINIYQPMCDSHFLKFIFQKELFSTYTLIFYNVDQQLNSSVPNQYYALLDRHDWQTLDIDK